jgi:hypothetical protein
MIGKKVMVVVRLAVRYSRALDVFNWYADELQENSEDDDLVANDDANSDDEWMHSAMRMR